MSNDLLNILSNSNKDIDNQKLMDYISGKLSQQEQHELEKEMADNELMNDAVEGLKSIKDQQSIQSYVEQLNKNLKGKLPGNISWYGETVKLDLEARKIIERTGPKPQTYRVRSVKK